MVTFSMFDTDTLNLIAKENRHEQAEINHRANRILKITNLDRRQNEWNKLFPKTDLAIYGLTKEELEACTNTVY